MVAILCFLFRYRLILHLNFRVLVNIYIFQYFRSKLNKSNIFVDNLNYNNYYRE